VAADWGRVLIADANGSVRASLSSLFERTGFRTTEAVSGHDALAAARRKRPALVVIDVQLPGISGYEVCHELREQYGQELPIIFLSETRTEPSDRVAGLLVGADDYIVKPFDADEVLARARNLLRRVEPERVWARNGALTKREYEVLELLASGLAQKEIAERLVISPTTVATHIQRILGKLGVHSRAEAVARAHRDRLVDVETTADVVMEPEADAIAGRT
jgi:DNA-binding NarL/FixJ family response regulator